jgi:alpha-L-fucosidase
MTSAHDLVWMLSDVVSKNGNLHLGVGPKADGSISDLQMAPLLGLGSWLKINGEAIYGTRPWVRAEGRTSDNVEVRFTTKGKALYAIVNASPKDKSVQIKMQTNKPLKATLLGSNVVLDCQQTAESLRVKLPDVSAPIDVYTLKLEGV